MDSSYNNSFGTQPPAPSGTGDIILQPDKPVKSRKGIFIGIGVLLVLLVVALVVFFVTGGGIGSKGSGGSNDNVSVETAFNRYANYLVSGEVKDSKITIEELDDETELERKYNNYEYIDEALKLYDFFKKNAMASSESPYSFDLNKGSEELVFLKEIAIKPPISVTALLKEYNDGGRGLAWQYIENYYVDDDEEDNESLKEYRKTDTDRAKTILNIWDIYQRNGCMQDGVISDECVSGLSDDLISQESSVAGELELQGNRYVTLSLRFLKEQTKNIINNTEENNAKN